MESHNSIGHYGGPYISNLYEATWSEAVVDSVRAQPDQVAFERGRREASEVFRDQAQKLCFKLSITRGALLLGSETLLKLL